jgi:hypothetical protein
MSDRAPHVPLSPFCFVARASVPWWRSNKKDFQEDIVPKEYVQPPTGILDHGALQGAETNAEKEAKQGKKEETNAEREARNRIKR